jgi:arginine decarboxylase
LFFPFWIYCSHFLKSQYLSGVREGVADRFLAGRSASIEVCGFWRPDGRASGKYCMPLIFIQSLQITVLDLPLRPKNYEQSKTSLEETELGKDMVPKKIFFTKGVGKHKERLTSFELALRDAGIAAQNLVRVSSIFPPNCKLVPRSQGLKYLSPGEVVFAVVAENSTHEPHRLLASSIGVAIPADRNTYGYLSEHHSFGETEDSAGDYAEELAAEMLATTLNVEFDSDRSWDEKKEIYRISNKIVRTANVTQSAVGDKRGLWTTVIASAVLIFD